MAQYPPLCLRVVKTGTVYTGLAEARLQSFVCRGDYKRWSEESMSLAVDAVLNSGLSVRRAAQEYDVPKSTLSNCVTR